MTNFINAYFYIFLALLAGIMIPTQGAINNKLAQYVGSPVLSAFVSFAVGTVALLVYLLAAGVPLGNIALAKTAPPVVWLGGILGAFFVASSIMLIPRIGVALTFSLIVAGQMLITLVIDHFGVLGAPVKHLSAMRVVGAALITIGVVLIRKF